MTVSDTERKSMLILEFSVTVRKKKQEKKTGKGNILPVLGYVSMHIKFCSEYWAVFESEKFFLGELVL